MNQKRHAVCNGFPYYARFLADMMNEHARGWRFDAFQEGTRLGMLRTLLALRKADALICFGGPAPNGALIEVARRKNIPVFVIWAGSDVLKARAMPTQLQTIKQERFYHISDGPWLVDELAVLGITAEYEPLTAVRPGAPVRQFPDEFRVLTYLPEPRREFYGATTVYEVARRMPDVRFHVVGAGGRDLQAPENVEFHGYVSDMERRIDDATVILRMPEHDGKSMLVLEALSRARHVVWNYEFPHVRSARSLEGVLKHLSELRAAHAAGELPLNQEGRAFALHEFNRAKIAANFERRLDAAAQEKAARTKPRKRVAISGLDLFCAEACENVKRYLPDWEPFFLRTNSRLEVFASIASLMRCDVWYTIGSPLGDRWVHLAAKIFGMPRVLHWVGSDILTLSERPQLRRALTRPDMLHLAEAGWTAETLRSLGIPARIAPLPPAHLAPKVEPLPETFTIVLYVPASRADFYGRQSYERLMRSFMRTPIRYLIVGGGELEVPPGVDAQNLGWRHDLHDVYRNATMLIRNTPRDGLSLMVLEALSYGRHVLWTQEFPHCRRIRTSEDIEHAVFELFELHKAGRLRPHAAAAQMVQRHYNPPLCIKTIASAWNDAAGELRPAEIVIKAEAT
jgi:glycosyltransferase involved in cell wall biosynthesis